jgi:hypothetical protein
MMTLIEVLDSLCGRRVSRINFKDDTFLESFRSHGSPQILLEIPTQIFHANANRT